MGEEMNITERRVGNALVISPQGHLDSRSAKDFQEIVEECIGGGEKSILLDFSMIDYVSSAGLRAILTLAKHQKEKNGKLAVCSLVGSVKDIFRISGFETIIDVYADQESALGNL
jgi:stage II sporulation protein AA (anti-sigma F factor antagonist)